MCPSPCLATPVVLSQGKKVASEHHAIPTEVSHLDVVVGLCSDDPKDFYNLEDRSVLTADQIRAVSYTHLTLPTNREV